MTPVPFILLKTYFPILVAKADLVTQLWSKRCLLKLLGKFFPPRPWKAPPFCFDHDM